LRENGNCYKQDNYSRIISLISDSISLTLITPSRCFRAVDDLVSIGPIQARITDYLGFGKLLLFQKRLKNPGKILLRMKKFIMMTEHAMNFLKI